ncbi:SDR family oxidoreductase [Bacteriovoracales bacterium]|nr:SDR family oxidoreductase [Bacteriovoracales bacterium]
MAFLQKFNLEEKVGLITGAAGLLGKEHAYALGEAGATVYITDLNQEVCEKACVEIKKNCLNPKSVYIPLVLDVTQEDSVKKALGHVIETSGKIDILINNAAIDPKIKNNQLENTSRLENFPLESWLFQINVGLTGAFLCAKHFGNWMAENGGGVILNMASDLSVMAPDQRIYQLDGIGEKQQPVKPVTYSVIKSGLVGLTKYLSTYWAHKNVRANAISPGGVFNQQSDEFVKKLTPLIPLGRMANADEYRGCIQFLCSDASSYVNGINLLAEGGRSAW